MDFKKTVDNKKADRYPAPKYFTGNSYISLLTSFDFGSTKLNSKTWATLISDENRNDIQNFNI